MWSLNGDHSWHYFLIQNNSKCRPTKIHQINIKCIVCNKNNNKLVFNLSVENTFTVFDGDIWLDFWICQISLIKNNSCVLHRQMEHSFGLVLADNGLYHKIKCSAEKYPQIFIYVNHKPPPPYLVIILYVFIVKWFCLCLV